MKKILFFLLVAATFAACIHNDESKQAMSMSLSIKKDTLQICDTFSITVPYDSTFNTTVDSCYTKDRKWRSGQKIICVKVPAIGHVTAYKIKDTIICRDTVIIITDTVPDVDTLPSFYGVNGNGDNVTDKKIDSYNGLINGFNIRMDAATFNPSKGVWNTKYITDQLDAARRKGLKVILMMYTGDNMPAYMFQAGADKTKVDGVFAPVKTDRGTYPFYMDPDYDINLKMIWSKWVEVITPYKDIIVALNPTMGSTGDIGDDGGYKGNPVDAQYVINGAWWDAYTKNGWLYFDTKFNAFKTLINVGNGGEYLEWAAANLKNMIAIKQGSLTHGIDQDNEVSQMQRIAKYPQLFIRGEMERGAFSSQLVTAIVFQCAYAGIDIINVAPDKISSKGLQFAKTYFGTDSLFWYPHSGPYTGAYLRGIEVTGGTFGLNDGSPSEMLGMHYWSGSGNIKLSKPVKFVRVWYRDATGSIQIGSRLIKGTGSGNIMYADLEFSGLNNTVNSSLKIFLLEGK